VSVEVEQQMSQELSQGLLTRHYIAGLTSLQEPRCTSGKKAYAQMRYWTAAESKDKHTMQHELDIRHVKAANAANEQMTSLRAICYSFIWVDGLAQLLAIEEVL